MKNDVTDYLLKYVEGDGYRRIFPASEREAAQRFRKQQREAWNSLLQRLRSEFEKVPDIGLTVNAIDMFRNWLSSTSGPVLNEQETSSDAHVVTWFWPLLDNDTQLPTSEDWKWLMLGGLVYAASSWGNRERAIRPSDLSQLMQDPRVARALIEFLVPDETIVNRLAATKNSINDDMEKVQQKLAEFDAAINKAREDAIFKAATALWRGKAIRHTISYAIGFAAIGTLVALAVWNFISHAAAIKAMLPVNEKTGEYTYLAVLIVALSFVAGAWILRLIGRFVVENFNYATDAQQRRMILQTFLTLVGTPEAEMKDGERALILSALFRPAPGQSADDPTPTTLAELLKGSQSGAPAGLR